ncbi:MAG: O-antigen ligase family protein [Lachnospiraceae bacterium]|nr:O-antigen ligase family protein [Lachnospiraceae bacterium]
MKDINIRKKITIREGAVADFLVFVALCLFVLSPLIQTVREMIWPNRGSKYFGRVSLYPNLVGNINYIVAIVAILFWLLLVRKVIRRGQQGEWPKLFLPLLFFGILAVWMYVSQAVNGFTEEALVGDTYRSESLFTFVVYLLGYFFLATILRSDKLRQALCYIFLGSNGIIGIMVLVDYFWVKLEVFSHSEGMAAIFHQFNHYGYYLVLGILVSAVLFIVSGGRLWLRAVCVAVFVLDNIVLILNNTFGCYLAVIAALLFCAGVFGIARRDKGECLRAGIILGAFIVITVAMHLTGHSAAGDVAKLANDIENISAENENAKYAGTGRWTLWKTSVESIKERPIFGWGVDGIADRLDAATEGLNNRPHNEFLQWAAFFGVPAFLLYFAALCLVMFGMFPRLKKLDAVSLTCFITSAGYIASSMFGNTTYYTAPFFFIFLGMTCRDRYYINEADKS